MILKGAVRKLYPGGASSRQRVRDLDGRSPGVVRGGSREGCGAGALGACRR
jgi:hypothetical protein